MADTVTSEDIQYMTRCVELARQAHEAGETAVGAIVVRAGRVLGEGVESTRGDLDPSAHAEVHAIKAACRSISALDLSGCTLYSTVEPCLLCGYAIRATRIDHVVIGVPAGEIGAVSSDHAFLADSTFKKWGHPPTIVTGVLAAESAALLAR